MNIFAMYKKFFKSLIKEPLIHFLVIGVGLFGLYALVNPDAMQTEKRIVVDQGRIDSVKGRFQRVWQREPTEKELQGLIDDFVMEEIYYREALAMGIDKNDPVIRRRLRQKMEIYTDNLAATLTPSDEDLQRYLQQHPDMFKTDDRYSFQHIYINPDRPARKLKTSIQAVKTALHAGKSVNSDQSLLPAQFNDATTYSIDRTFGKGFAKQLDNLPLNTWSSPLRSGLGLHFIKLSNRKAGELPALQTVRGIVEREWRNDKAQKIDKSVRKKLLASYDIVIKLPEDK